MLWFFTFLGTSLSMICDCDGFSSCTYKKETPSIQPKSEDCYDLKSTMKANTPCECPLIGLQMDQMDQHIIEYTLSPVLLQGQISDVWNLTWFVPPSRLELGWIEFKVDAGKNVTLEVFGPFGKLQSSTYSLLYPTLNLTSLNQTLSHFPEPEPDPQPSSSTSKSSQLSMIF